MGFYTEFALWLDALLATYVTDQTARVAAAIEPLVFTLCVLYVMIWGYLALSGKVEEPLFDAIKRFFAIGVVFSVAIHLWLYNEVIVATVFHAPAALAAVVVGTYEPLAVIDQVLQDGMDAGGSLMARASLLHGFSFYIAGLAVCILIGVVCVYAMFLLSLSKVALSVLLAIGPLFIVSALFNATRRFLEAWIAQLINYALITVLTTLVCALMLHIISLAAEQALAISGGITFAHAARVCVAAGLTLLIMRQVLPIAAGLAHGLGLASQGVVSEAMLWALGAGRRTTSDFLRGAADQQAPRWDSPARLSGYGVKVGTKWAATKAWNRVRRPNAIRHGGTT